MKTIAVGIHPHDVAGVVPAAERLELRVGFRVEVAAHDIGSAHEQPPALRDPFDRFEPVFDAGQELAGGAVARAHRQVGAQARAAFGGAVTFQNPHAELAHPQGGGSLLDLFRAGKQVAQGAEIVGMGLAGVAVEEGVGAEEYRAVQVVEGGRDDAVMQGRRIEQDKHAPHQRQQQADGQPEAVEQRQGIEEAVRLHQVNHREHLADVGQQVAVREFDAFGLTLGAAGEEDDGGVVS